jgi:hypothetical protein
VERVERAFRPAAASANNAMTVFAKFANGSA